ncbi:hypothetical protein LCGC14_0863980 [marine sediment metagenome]|uniref:Phage virion morphogenesis protein n=1 Tax=marine sediment metagenome TaxID=412755 RepID=A0A0F9PBL5_9ZZZZ
MARPVIDISILGDKALERALSQLPDRIQRKVVRQSLHKSAKRVNGYLIRNLSGIPVAPDSGKWLAAQTAQKPKSGKRSRRGVRIELGFPTREELGIPAGDKYFYPAAIEYGTHKTRQGRGPLPAFAPVRRAVNENTDKEHRLMGTEIGQGIEREARRAFAKMKIK